MSQALVQSAFTSTTATANPSVAYTSNVTKGNLLCVLAQVMGATATCTSMGISDTLNNVWTPVFGSIQSPAGGTINKFLMGWFCIANSTGPLTVTSLTNAASFGNSLIEVAEFSGYTFAILDNALASAKAAALTASALAFNTNFANEVIFVFAFTNETGITLAATPALGYTAGPHNATVTAATFYAIAPTAGSIPFGATWVGGSGGNTNVSVGFSVANSTATFVVSGNCGLPGALIAFSGTSAGSTVADGAGNYSLSLPNGTYTLTPSSTGYTFTPASVSVTVSGAPITQNFTAVSSSFNVWQKLGVIISPLASDDPGQPNVLFETGSIIIGGSLPVFKMWFGTANGVCYAESADGLTFERYTSNPIVSSAAAVFPRVFKHGSTYYLYSGVAAGPMGAYTSTDGVTFTLQNANAIAVTQAWEGGFIGQLNVALVDANGTWWGYYTALDTVTNQYAIGRATSIDGIHWTKFLNNPTVTVGLPSNFEFHAVNNVLYGWSEIVQAGIPTFGSLSIPSDISRYYAYKPWGPWNLNPLSTIYRTVANEGAGLAIGQIADPTIVAANGNLYQYFTITPTGTGSSGYQIAGAVAPNTTFANLVATQEGVHSVPFTSPSGLALNINTLASDVFARANANPIGGNWTRLTSSGNFQVAQIVSGQVEGTVAGDNSDSYYNAITWGPDQWSQVTVNVCLANSFVGVSLRMSTSGALTAYRMFVNGTTESGGTWTIQLANAGVLTNLTGGTLTTLTIGDVLTGCVVGTELSFYQNGNLLGSWTDSTITSGAAGFGIAPITSVSNAALGTWSGGNFVLGTQPAAPLTTTPASTWIQFANAVTGSAGSSQAITFPVTNTAGNCLFVMTRVTATASGTGTASIADSLLNTGWQIAFSIVNAKSTLYLFFCPNCKGGTNTITLTKTDGGTSDFFTTVIAEAAGLTATPLLQHATGGPTTGTAVNSTGIIVSALNTLIIGGVANETANSLTFTSLGESFVNETNANGNVFFASVAETGAGTYTLTGTLSSSVNWEAGIAAFQLAPQGGSTGVISAGSVAGYGTDISASTEFSTNPAGETNSSRTSIMGTNRGSRFIG